MHSNVLNVRIFRVAVCDIDLVANVSERSSVIEQISQKFDGEKFNLRRLNELEVTKQCQMEITKRFATLENLSVDEDINRVCENIKENINTSVKDSLVLHELKQHLRFDEECSGFLDHRKQHKMQWVQDTNHCSVDNLNNLRRDASRHFRKKEGISES